MWKIYRPTLSLSLSLSLLSCTLSLFLFIHRFYVMKNRTTNPFHLCLKPSHHSRILHWHFNIWKYIFAWIYQIWEVYPCWHFLDQEMRAFHDVVNTININTVHKYYGEWYHNSTLHDISSYITICPPGYHHNGFMATPEPLYCSIDLFFSSV